MAWIDSLLKRMVELNASDLHLTSDTTPMFRIDGDMVPVEECPGLSPEQMQQVLFEIAPERNQKQFTEEWDSDFAYEIEDVARYRVNMFTDLRGPGAVLRLIPSEVLTADQLNLPKAVLDMCFLSKGLVLVTGPTGSGKSTTLAAMVDFINKRRSDHIITIEDPVEFVHKDIKCLLNQRQVGEHTEGFKRALRAALREDPDIVLVGEMRDLETIEIAIETAETGHLVFGTLHTTTAPSTVDRIIDQFPADRQAQIRTMLSASLKGVVSQTLCKKKPKGRVAALEILVVNSAIAAQIREGKTHQIPSAMQMGGRLGMKSMNAALTELVGSGDVEPEEAYIKAVDKEGFVQSLTAIGKSVDLSKIGATPSEEDPSMGGLPGTGGPASVPGVGGAARNPYEDTRAPLPSSGEAPAQGAPALGAAARGADPFDTFKRGRN
ncbi:MAG: twitching motility protein PilT [Chlamydiales bacterium]|jgi:twitching motility protein PilT